MSAPEAQSVPLPHRTRFRVDAAILIALAPIVAAAVRIWMYSGGDISLFLVLVRTLNIPAVLIGTGALMAPSGIVVLTVILLTDARFRGRAQLWVNSNRLILTVAIPIVLVLVGYTTPWPTLVGVAVICAVAIGYHFIQKARRKSKPQNDSKSRVGPDSVMSVITIVVLFLVTPSNMWLPMERIEIHGQKSQTGYVLESNDSWTTILTNERDLNLVRTPDITSRKVCSSDNPGTLALSIQKGGVRNGVDCQ